MIRRIFSLHFALLFSCILSLFWPTQELHALTQKERNMLICTGIVACVSAGVSFPIRSCIRQTDERNRIVEAREQQMSSSYLTAADFKELRAQKTYFIQESDESKNRPFVVLSQPFDSKANRFPEGTIQYGVVSGLKFAKVGHYPDSEMQFLDSKSQLSFTGAVLSADLDFQIYDEFGKLQYRFDFKTSKQYFRSAREIKVFNRDGYVTLISKTSNNGIIHLVSESGDLLGTLKPMDDFGDYWRVDVFDTKAVPPEVVISLVNFKG